MEHIPHHSRAPLGQIARHQKFGMNQPLPPVRSFVSAGARRTHERETWTEQFYGPRYQAADTPTDHLKFALEYEPLHLGIVVEALTQIGPSVLEAWVRREPTGKYSRRAWFLYETRVEETLDLPDAQAGNYVDALDESRHFGASGGNSARHRVHNNLLGTAAFCPTLRRTRRLELMRAARLDAQAVALTQQYDPETLARAVSYLYTKETRSSFPHSRSKERPPARRARRGSGRPCTGRPTFDRRRAN